MLALSIVHDLETRSIDFVFAFSQADLDVPDCMEFSVDFDCVYASKLAAAACYGNTAASARLPAKITGKSYHVEHVPDSTRRVNNHHPPKEEETSSRRLMVFDMPNRGFYWSHLCAVALFGEKKFTLYHQP